MDKNNRDKLLAHVKRVILTATGEEREALCALATSLYDEEQAEYELSTTPEQRAFDEAFDVARSMAILDNSGPVRKTKREN